MGQSHTSSIRPSTRSKIDFCIFSSIFLVPPMLLRIGLIPFHFRYHVLGMMIVLVTIYYAFKLYILPRRKFRWKGFILILKTLGLRKDNLAPAFKLNFIFSAVSILAMFVYTKISPLKQSLPENLPLFIAFYVISSLVQEFWFRCVVFAEFKHRKISNFWFVVASSLNFAYLHIFFKDTSTMIVTLIGGIVWGIIYTKYPNFWMIGLSHLVLGISALLFGFIGNIG